MRRISYILILCLSILFVQAKDFRFALFTDLHITHSTPAVEDLQRAVDQVNATSGIDFVLVSGDITEEGDLASLQKAKSILDKLKVTYYITSGNHETKWSESGCTDFNKVFGADRFRFEHNGYLFLGFNSGPVMRMADGHVAPQDISWLKQELTKAGAEKPVILVSHYPLQDGDVDNWYEVTDAVRPFHIKVILGGHYHSNRQLFYDGIPGLLNRSTLRAKADAGGYSIYQVTNDSIVVSEQTIGGEPKRWAGVSLTNTYYTADNSTYKRPDFSVNKSYPQVKMGWSAATGKGAETNKRTLQTSRLQSPKIDKIPRNLKFLRQFSEIVRRYGFFSYLDFNIIVFFKLCNSVCNSSSPTRLPLPRRVSTKCRALRAEQP